MLAELDDYNWEQVFGYADGSKGSPEACVGFAGSLARFTREDVKVVIAQRNGENDGPHWVCLVELNDGRFATLSAGCDYTGWG